jgi:alpha-tubulin suppressor-like RCC1 family protein
MKDVDMTTRSNSRVLKQWMLAAASAVALVACGGGGGGGGGSDVAGAPPDAPAPGAPSSGLTPAFPLQPDTISAGENFSCALKLDGTAACWGSNGLGVGSLGNDSAAGSVLPVQAQGLINMVAIDAFGGTDVTNEDGASCAVSSFGEVFCWGSNADGQLGQNSNIDFKRIPTQTTGIADVVTVTKGSRFTCAIHTESRVVSCWGLNIAFQLGSDLGIGISRSSTPVKVDINGQRMSGVSSISAGEAHVCALLRNGIVNCWGTNGGNRVLGLDPSIVKSLPFTKTGFTAAVTALSAGRRHTCAVLVDGKIACWGANTNGQLGDGTTNLRTEPVNVPGISDAVAVSSGQEHTCAIRATGSVLCWGRGFQGNLGQGQFVSSLVPVTVQGLQDAVALSAGVNHTCAIRANKTAVCWGETGLLGSPTSADSAVPVEVTGGAIFGK